ncbi:hypothetical protein HYH02_007048 [Chlamydomonas schloesseri]|uniref:3-hydroxyisobutyrate dehydrogenase n=1 Tax=Chlamydomonas schloesseri TaxID=2026947 RepID=A0A835WJH4_9CHLO|nr:hypothetical protein HYH02_007048 [Chlamydomonas schloesseri]|eukprot:KAG2448020.1 hypothetical protein HYH02_007048 [Chlamydomonas schloesseri]
MTNMRGAAVGFRRGLSAASASAQGEKVGFVGLGAMGLRMARHLLASGRDLVVFDSNSIAVDRILSEAAAAQAAAQAHGLTGPGSAGQRPGTAGRGGGAGQGASAGSSGGGGGGGSARGYGSATAVTSPAELAETPGVGVVFTMLPGPAIARQVYLGQAGLLAPKAGIVPRVLVDCTTLDPVTARELAARVRATRVHAGLAGPRLAGLPAANPTLLDAPVSGGVVGADKGTLSFLVGGEEAALPTVEPLLKAMGTSVTWCGDAGDGQAARLCTSLVMASTMAATSEALALARRLGVDPELMSRVLNTSSAASWVSANYNPVPGLSPDAPASKGYRGGLRSAQVQSHLQMAVAAAERCHSPVPMARQVLGMYTQVVEEGMGDQDFASVYRYVYGSGAESGEWKEGQTLFGAQHP